MDLSRLLNTPEMVMRYLIGDGLSNAVYSMTMNELFPSNKAEQDTINQKIQTLPRVNMTDRQLFDVELLITGGFAPLRGFLNEADYNSVVDNCRLANGDVWPIPIVFDVHEDVSEDVASGEVATGTQKSRFGKYSVGDELLLCDRYGNPIAVLTVESVYQPDKKKEAEMVYGTTDTTHPGVKYLFESTGDVYLGGSVTGIQLSAKYDFQELRYTPRQLREWFAENDWDRVVAFQTRNPMHRAHLEIVRRAAKEIQGYALIHPVVGLTREGDIDYITRVRAYRKVHENYAKDFAKLALLTLAMRMAGPREALWHAIIRKNHGCTHFVVGRDHAGPGKDGNGKPFYGPYDAHKLLEQYKDEIGIEVVPQRMVSYVEEVDGYLTEDELESHHTSKMLSGTELRGLLKSGDDVPEWFSFPEVIDELREGYHRANSGGLTIFFTGLSGAGKSTVANIVYRKLLEIQHKKITYLDGDVVRQNLSKGLGFSKEDRDTNIERIGFVANEITRHGGIAICSAIAPYIESREKNRRLISENGAYVEVYVRTPVEICRKRDTKGLYRKADEGILKNFTGVSDPYEAPVDAEMDLDTKEKMPEQCADEVIDYLKQKQLI